MPQHRVKKPLMAHQIDLGTFQRLPVRTDHDAADTMGRHPFADDAVLYSPMTEMTLKRLKPGQHVRLKTFNPISMTPTESATSK